MNTEEQIIELESRLAFQEHTIAELNDVVTAQQQQLDNVYAMVQMLNKKLQELADSGAQGAPLNEKPPHY